LRQFWGKKNPPAKPENAQFTSIEEREWKGGRGAKRDSGQEENETSAVQAH